MSTPPEKNVTSASLIIPNLTQKISTRTPKNCQRLPKKFNPSRLNPPPRIFLIPPENFSNPPKILQSPPPKKFLNPPPIISQPPPPKISHPPPDNFSTPPPPENFSTQVHYFRFNYSEEIVC